MSEIIRASIRNKCRVRAFRTRKRVQSEKISSDYFCEKITENNDIACVKVVGDTNIPPCNELTNVASSSFLTESKKIKINSDIEFENQREIKLKLDNSVYNKENSTNCRFSSDDESSTSDCDSSSEDEGENKNSKTDSPVAMALREWVIEERICYSKVDSLLSKLKPLISSLPLSHKTLLKFKPLDDYKIEKFDKNDVNDTSEFLYCGISKQLQITINPKLHEDSVLKLQFNIDGLPVFQSSSKEFWPILGRVCNSNSYDPFIVAIYYGIGKPKSAELYLNDFVEELNTILKNGVQIQERNFQIKVKCLVCDRPARSFVKCIKGHTGYFSCERCIQSGSRTENRTIFPVIDSEKRTNLSFRLQTHIEHHNSVSPLTLVKPEIDMVNDFVLDFMHLGCLGVTKKLLEYWTGTGKSKLSKTSIMSICQRLMNLSGQIPCEFQRTTRSLGEMSKWKAVEFRFFLLYCGPFVLKDVLLDDNYKHFLLFSIACRILSSDELFPKYINHAEIYLKTFVKIAAKLYGLESQLLNMHSLVHLADDVRTMGCSLSHIMAFPFEDKLGKIKKCLRSGHKPLQQLCRQMEQEAMTKKKNITSKKESFEVLRSKAHATSVNIIKVRYLNFVLTTKSPNNAVILKNGDIMRIQKMSCLSTIINVNSIAIIGEKVKIAHDAFKYPTQSSLLDIFEIEESNEIESVSVPLQEIKYKAVMLQIFELNTDKKKVYIVPMLH